MAKKRAHLPPQNSDSRILAAGNRFELVADVAWDPVEASEGSAPKVRKFNGTAYTGGPLQVSAYYYPVVLDLTGITTRAKSIPSFLNHDPTGIVGHIDGIEIATQTIKVAGLMSGAGAAKQEVAESADNGFPWKMSVGVYPTNVEFVAEKASAKANGRTFQGPCNIVRGGSLEEVSFVPIGADGKTSVKVAATSHQRRSTMNEFEQWVKAEFCLDPATLTEEQRTRLQARFDADHEAPTTPATVPTTAPALEAGATAVDPVATYRAHMAAETDRIGAIQAEFNGEFQPLQASAIREGWDIARVKAELKRERELRDLRAGRPSGPGIHSQDSSGHSSQVIEAAMCISAGLPQKWLGTQFDEKTMNAALDRKMRDVTLHYVMDEAIRAAGEYYSGSRKSEGFIKAALQAERKAVVHAGFSTISLSGILSNIANKAMLASYEAIEVVWPSICATRSHSDFKAVTRYRLDAKGAFQKVGPDGELKHVGLSEAGYTNQLDTYGAIIALTRQMMIDDDLGAFLQLPTILGRMCAVRLEEAVFSLLLGNAGNFFHANNRNLVTGAGSALSIDAISVAEQKFLDQVDSNKKPILCSPSVLLVPSTLKTTAENLYNEKGLIAGTSTAKQPARNPHVGKYPPATSPYLNNTAIRDSDGEAFANQSDTGWYLFANPAVRAAIAVATLNGRNVPIIESSDAEFQTLGMQWRAYHDFGVGFEDPVAGVKNNGA